MRAKKLSISVVLALLWACVTAPPQALLQPRVASLKGEAGYDFISLEAVLENAENITSAGFYLWADNNQKQRKECQPSGNRISATFTGLAPFTIYQYAAFVGNGKEEILSEISTFSTMRIPVPDIQEIDVATNTYSATLKARLTNTSHLTSAGFILGGNEESATKVVVPLMGNTLTYTWENLSSDMEYSFRVFCENGYEMVESAPQVFKTAKLEFEPGLLEYLLNNFDTDGNGAMSQSELQGITEIVLSDIYLESLDGLETLVNLKSLSMGNNWLETIDLSANKKLEFFSGGRDPHLKHIIIDNPELYYLYLMQADNLKTIDLALCPKLSNFECYGVKLETMDFSHNGQLQVVFIHESNLKELDLSSIWNLRHLGSHDNLQLETIWLKEGIMMESLEIDSHTQIQYR